MEYRRLGHSGLNVSVLTLGTMGFGGGGMFAPIGQLGVEDARRQVDMCLDAGVNLFDTADMYTNGVSEETLGKAIAGRRDELLLATKARMVVGDGPNDGGVSRFHLIRSVERSLQRLGTDRIDLYQLHAWDGHTPLEETLDALDTLVRQGKVRYVGCSNYSGWHLMKALGVSERLGLQRFVTQQIHYTLQSRDAEHELVPLAVDQDCGILVWSPLAGGLLSGKYRRGEAEPEGTRRTGGDWDEPPVHDWEQLYDIVDVLVEIAEAHDASAAQVAVAWLLTRPGVSSVIIAARTEEQLADNLKAADLRLRQAELSRLEEVSRKPLPYPHWHQLQSASERMSPADATLLGPRR